jgi:fumarate reductase flavoprotein subunit
MASDSRAFASEVVVVGGGGAGLAGAVSAASAGASVTLIEKCETLGGTTGIAIGSFTASGTLLQKNMGIQDTPEWHDEDMSAFAGHRDALNNVKLRRYFAQNSNATLEWLYSLGLQFYGPSPEPPNRVPRMHNVIPSAKTYIAMFQAKALSLGVRILPGHKALRLIQDADHRVTGVIAEGPGGAQVRLEASKGVILAAGDYSNGAAVKQQFLPRDVAAIDGINPNSTGDGHLLAREAGADLVNMELVYGPELRFISPPKPPFAQLLPANPRLARVLGTLVRFVPRPILHRMLKRLLVTWQHPETSLFRDGALLINRNGQRFCDETSTPELAVAGQPVKSAWILLDGKLAQRYSAWPHYISTAPDIAYAYVEDYRRLRPDIYADGKSLDDLAVTMGWNAADLKESVAAYNRAATGGAPDPFERRQFSSPLVEPPFIALGPLKSWIVTTEGGVRINQDMEALDSFGVPIPGLYAAGSNGMGGIVIWGHGLHIAWALTSGRLA